ncbi:MAG: ATP-binding protein, partial [Nitrososphaerota archaeon]
RDIEAKGKSLPLRVFPLIERQSRQPAARPPLVGRRQDLLQLEVLKARALEERQPQVLTILAPAGTGKTRLVEEFLGRLDPADGFRSASLHCQPYGQVLTFAPLHRLLNELLDGEITRGRVEDAFLAGGYSAEEATQLAQYVVHSFSGEHDGVADPEGVLNARRLLIESLARAHPLIILFEDLHWASDTLLDQIEQLMRPRAPVPLMLVALSRVELLDRRPSWGNGQRNTTLMTLQPLKDEQTRDLVHRLSEGLPEDVCATIAARSAGNPFFAVELARALAERQARGDAPSAAVLPDTVHAAVQARLDLLTLEERMVVRVASVVGPAFTAPQLHAVLPDQPSEAMRHILESLLAYDLLVRGDAGSYAFRHALIREVAYGSLARAERVRVHAALATWLEDNIERGDMNTLELAAYHYCQAITLAHQSAVPLDVPLEGSRAVATLEQAGIRAGRAGAFSEAGDYLRAAIIIAPTAGHVRLSELLGDSVGWGRSAMTAYHQALAQWRASETRDPLTGARLLRKIMISSLRSGASNRLTPDEIAAFRTEAGELVTRAGDEDERQHLRVADLFMTQVPGEHGGTHVTMADGMEAVSYFEAKGDWQSFSEALDGCAVYALLHGLKAHVLAVSQRRLTAPELPAVERNDAISMTVRAYLALGLYDKSIAAAWDGLARIPPGSPVGYLTDAIAGVTLAIWVSGRWEELDRLKTALKEKFGAADERTMHSLLSASFGTLVIALCREDAAEAEACFTALDSFLTREVFPNDRMLLDLYRTGDISLMRLDPNAMQVGTTIWFVLMYVCERDLSVPADILSLAQADPIRSHIATLPEVAAVASALDAGNLEELASAIDTVEANGLIPFAAHMRIVLAERTGDPAPLAQARPVLECLGDRLFLRKLDEVARRLA